MNVLELKKVNKIYRYKKKKNHVLRDVCLTFGNTGMTFIIGKSGSGKSTLLNVIGGLDQYDSGEMVINGKSMNHFTEKDYDIYRNYEVGFIFQQFNILEDYNVYDNIVLALKLQNRKIEEEEIEQLLERLQILPHRNRKVNELSGGEQQRVAIARALIKHPQIILADEPTGNLDSETGKQVMDILKDISRETLVIVVTHDLEFAKRYGDRIIQIQDGIIVSNPIDVKDTQVVNDVRNKTSKLPFWDAVKLGIHSLFCKKIKLLFTILLITFSTLFLTLMFILYTYDVNDNHIQLLKKYHNNQIEIKKYSYSQHPDMTQYVSLKLPCKLNATDVDAISNHIQNGYPVYEMTDPSMSLYVTRWLRINIQEPIDFFDDSMETDLYTNETMNVQLIASDTLDQLIDEPIIGSYPKELDEIMISNYVADLMIQYGVYLYNSDEVFYPKTYEEIVNSNLKYYFGEKDSVKIAGIVNYDMKEFHELKGLIYLPSDTSIQKKYSLFNKYTNIIYNKIYVKSGFIEQLDVGKVFSLDDANQYSLKISENVDLASFHNSFVLQGEIMYYDGKEWKTTDTLEKNEVILNIKQLIPDFNDYKKKLQIYTNQYISRNPLDIEKEFLKTYYSLESYIGKQFDLKIYLECPILYQSFDRTPNVVHSVKVIGYTGLLNANDTGNYFSYDLLGEYLERSTKISSIMIKEKNLNQIKKIINQFPYDGKYATYTLYSDDLEHFYNGLLQYKDLINIGTFVFFVFSILLICNFMFASVSSKQKDIGILKSLGASKKDIFKIFLVEGVLLSIIIIFVVILSLFLVFSCLTEWYNFGIRWLVNPFYISGELILLIFVYIVMIVCISSIVPVFKITRMKPIDAIRKI